jgi:hypothetical protein
LSQPESDLDALAELAIFSAYPSWVDYAPNALQYFYGPYAIKEYNSSEKMVLVRNPFWPDAKELLQPVLERSTSTCKQTRTPSRPLRGEKSTQSTCMRRSMRPSRTIGFEG